MMKMKIYLIFKIKIITILFIMSLCNLIRAEVPNIPYEYAQIQILDKINAQVIVKNIKIKSSFKIKQLIFKVNSCYKNQEYDENPESASHIEVYYSNNNDSPAFKGWIFKSTPSISGVEHPIYDVRLLNCNNGAMDNKIAHTKNSIPKKEDTKKIVTDDKKKKKETSYISNNININKSIKPNIITNSSLIILRNSNTENEPKTVSE